MSKSQEPPLIRPCPVCGGIGQDYGNCDGIALAQCGGDCGLILPLVQWNRLSFACQVLNDVEAHQGRPLINSADLINTLNQGVLYGLGLEEEAQYCQAKIRDYMAQSRAPHTTDEIRTYHDALCFHYSQLRMRLLNHMNAGKGK